MASKHVRRARVNKVVRYAVLTVFAIIIVFPLYIVFLDAVLSNSQIATTPPTLFTFHPHWNNFAVAWRVGGVSHYLFNSILQTSIIVMAQLVTSILAAFAFAFLDFPFKRTLFVIMISTLMIPFEVTLVTNVQTVSSLHLFGSTVGLVIPFLATGTGIFLLRQAFMQIPKEMREAAVIDGYSNMQFLRRVAVPLARPGIAALAVFSFLGAWNQYLWPLILTDNNVSIRTLQIGIKSIGGGVDSANVQIAASAIAVFPLLVILIFFQKHLVRSLTAGAVK